ncbi:hypothetical protein ANO11243_027480 [Dothideomycetidae sp. 11243]|nr:hypothetical protein ANO11243_027480 [fungal sp. No.11243]
MQPLGWRKALGKARLGYAPQARRELPSHQRSNQHVLCPKQRAGLEVGRPDVLRCDCAGDPPEGKLERRCSVGGAAHCRRRQSQFATAQERGQARAIRPSTAHHAASSALLADKWTA